MNKFQACRQKSDKPVHDYYSSFQIVLNENSDLPSDANSNQVDFNSVYLQAKPGRFPAGKKDQEKLETTPTPNLINLANQLS